MAFQKSACGVHLSTRPGATSLIATCNNDEGSGLETALVLDDYLGNEDGHLTWGGHGFSQKARNLSISSEGPNHDPILHVDLAGPDGKYTTSEIDLAEYVANIDGELVVLPL